MLDIVTSHNGYHADTTRTFFLGEQLPAATSAAHEFCREILSRIESRLRPGAVCSEIYRETAAEQSWQKTVAPLVRKEYSEQQGQAMIAVLDAWLKDDSVYQEEEIVETL